MESGAGFRRLVAQGGVWRNGDSQALTHLLHAVNSFQNRHEQHCLRFLSTLFLQTSAHEDIESLIRSPQLQIGFQRTNLSGADIQNPGQGQDPGAVQRGMAGTPGFRTGAGACVHNNGGQNAGEG